MKCSHNVLYEESHLAIPSFPHKADFRKPLACTGEVRPNPAASGRVLLHPGGKICARSLPLCPPCRASRSRKRQGSWPFPRNRGARWRSQRYAMGGCSLMAYTLGTAAKATGRNKTTILRAIKHGKIAALRDAASQAWLIEPAELHRVYPAVAGTPPDATERTTDATEELRARLADAQDQIRDLRRRLDQADADRRLAQQQLGEALQQVRLLTDQRAAPSAPARRNWLPWRRG